MACFYWKATKEDSIHLLIQNSNKPCHTRRSSNKQGREPINSRGRLNMQRRYMKDDTASTSTLTDTNSKVGMTSSQTQPCTQKLVYSTSHINNSLKRNWQIVTIKSISCSWKLNIIYGFRSLWQTLKMPQKFSQLTLTRSPKYANLIDQTKHKIYLVVQNSVRWPIRSRPRFQGRTQWATSHKRRPLAREPLDNQFRAFPLINSISSLSGTSISSNPFLIKLKHSKHSEMSSNTDNTESKDHHKG